MFFTKNYLSVRVRCPLVKGRIETVYVYGLSHGTSFEPVVCNGCDSMNGTAPCQRCTAGIVKRLKKNLDLLDEQPLDPLFEDE